MAAKTSRQKLKCPRCGKMVLATKKGFLGPHLSPGQQQCGGTMVQHIAMIEAAGRAKIVD